MKANHRQYMSNAAKYKEVVKVDDPEIQRKIHHTYRLQYLKDVVLARVMDDGTFTAMNSLIYFHQMSILQYVQGNIPSNVQSGATPKAKPSFLAKLFGLFSTPNTDLQKEIDALNFIQHCCNVAKQLQIGARGSLYQTFISEGLLSILAYALQMPDSATRVVAMEILGALLEHDATLLRGQIARSLSEGKSTSPITDVLIMLLLAEKDLGVQSQVADAIKHLLEPMPLQAPLETRNAEFLAKLRSNQLAHNDNPLGKWYEEATKRLFKPLEALDERESMDDMTRSEASLFAHLLDILSVLVKQYSLRSRLFLLSDPLAPRIALLLSSPVKHLKLSALKYFRSCIGLHEHFYNKQFISHNLFGAILDVLFETMPRDNMVNSVCLELFEFIKRVNFKELTIHLVDTYRPQLEQLSYASTFRELLEKYERFMAPPIPDNLSFTSVETEQTPLRHAANGGTTEAEEFNEIEADGDIVRILMGEDVTEEEASQLGTDRAPAPNGASSLKPLVDYPADEDDEMDVLAGDASPPLPAGGQVAAAVRQETPTPPERATGDRKRSRPDADDDEDELSKLGATPSKRRSSSTSSREAAAKSVASVRDDDAGVSEESMVSKEESSANESEKSNDATSPAVNGGGGGSKSNSDPPPQRQLRRKQHSINR
jgi:protein phosphatase-4 regulatory subunit 3